VTVGVAVGVFVLTTPVKVGLGVKVKVGSVPVKVGVNAPTVPVGVFVINETGGFVGLELSEQAQ
jgi:hypothetical protein